MTSPSRSGSSAVPLTLYLHSGAASKGQYQRRFQRGGRPTSVTLVLEYIASTGVTLLTPMEVRAWAREACGLDVGWRRVHDAFARLERMGVLQ